jgi:hypothetical protein
MTGWLSAKLDELNRPLNKTDEDDDGAFDGAVGLKECSIVMLSVRE